MFFRLFMFHLCKLDFGKRAPLTEGVRGAFVDKKLA
jgi:hypothetical protein